MVVGLTGYEKQIKKETIICDKSLFVSFFKK